MGVPKLYVLDRIALGAWTQPNTIELTFDETVKFIHDLQNALFDQRKLSRQSGLDFFIILIPKKEGQ